MQEASGPVFLIRSRQVSQRQYFIYCSAAAASPAKTFNRKLTTDSYALTACSVASFLKLDCPLPVLPRFFSKLTAQDSGCTSRVFDYSLYYKPYSNAYFLVRDFTIQNVLLNVHSARLSLVLKSMSFQGNFHFIGTAIHVRYYDPG